jgi:hypothetical protein
VSGRCGVAVEEVRRGADGVTTSRSGDLGERRARQGTSGDLYVLQEKMVELGGERGDVAGGGGKRKKREKRGKWGWEE